MALKYEIIVDDKGNPSIERLGNAVKKTDTLFLKLGATIAATFAADKIVSFAVDSVRAYDESETAITKLNTAMGGYSKALIEQANQLQEVTRFQDDATIAAQATLATFNLSEEQILKLIPALQNYAAATGTDLNDAADKAGRTITTTTNAMKRQGIEVENSFSKSKRLDSLMASLNNRFEGQAQAIAKVGAGPLVLLSNNYNNLQENIGKLITNFPIFTEAVKIANTVLGIASKITSEADDEYQSLAENIAQQTTPSFIDLNTELAKTISLAPTAGMVLSTAPKFGDQAAIDEIVKSFKLVKVEADATAGTVAESISKMNISLSKEKGKAKEKKTNDDVRTSDELEKTLDDELRFQREYEEGLVKAREESWERKRTLQQQEIELAKQVNAIQIENDEYEFESYKRRQQYQIEAVAGVANMLGAFAQLNTALKGDAEVSKMLARGQVIISTAQGIMKAYAQGGVLGFVTGAAIAAQGAAQLATIDAQKFANGGIVIGTGGVDSVQTWQTPGEMNLNKRQQSALFNMIDGASKGRSRSTGGITINIQGNLIGNREFVRDSLIPEISRELARA